MLIEKIIPNNVDTVLCLRTVKQDYTAYDGFKWPKLGYVEAPDFTTEAECGNGLHGYLRGAGDGESIKWDGIFQVVKVVASEVIQLDGKVKFPRCEVVFSGSQKEATDLLVKEYPGVAVIGAMKCGGNKEVVSVGYRGFATAGDRGKAMAGNYGKAMAGYLGTATTGYRGTATAGDDGTATAGYKGTATAGEYGNATAGDRGTATAGDRGKAMAGDYGTATAGDYGTATAGDYGTATVGYRGTATAGDDRTATVGYFGTATAGNSGIINIRHWDGNRYREIIGYIGEDGLLPNTAYKLDGVGKFIKAI